MAKVKPPRCQWDNERSTWAIVYQGKRTRLGLARGEALEAQKRLAEFVLGLGVEAPLPNRSGQRVLFDECLDRYLARRTDDDPNIRVRVVARAKELGQRIGKAADFFAGMPVSAMNQDLVERFVRFVGSESYAKRILGDVQAALNEHHAAGILSHPVKIPMPEAPPPREDYLEMEELRALVRVCWTHAETQVRLVKGRGFVTFGSRRRPWRHLVKFIAVAVLTCSRSSRVFEASYVREPGRPWIDLKRGVMHRLPPGARKTKKRAPPIRLNPRLVAAMRRWSSDRVVNGVPVAGDRYVVQYQGRAADPKKAFSAAIAKAMELHPDLFLRADGTRKHIVRHSLRHTGVTLLTNLGVPPVDICAYAGLTMDTYLRVYSHHHAASNERVIEAQSRRSRPKASEARTGHGWA